MLIYKMLWPWHKPHRVFEVELPILQCHKRLVEALERDQKLNPFAIVGSVIGEDDEAEFGLAKKGYSRYVTFYPRLFGSLRALNTATEVSLDARFSTPSTIMFVIFMAPLLLELLRRMIFLHYPWWSLIFFVVFLEVLVAFAYLTLWPHSNDAKYLEKFLVDLLRI